MDPMFRPLAPNNAPGNDPTFQTLAPNNDPHPLIGPHSGHWPPIMPIKRYHEWTPCFVPWPPIMPLPPKCLLKRPHFLTLHYETFLAGLEACSSVYNTYYELFWALPAREPGLGAVTPPANNAVM